MNKLNPKKWALLIGLSVFLFSSCGDDGGDDKPAATTNNGGGTATANKYSGAAAVGDLVTFSINKSAGTYEVTNETTNSTETGSFSVETDAAFAGIYRVAAAADTFFAVELDDKIVAANFPSGNPANDISLGVSSEIDNSGNLAQIAGDYVYVKLGSYLATQPMEWGVFTTNNDSLWGISMDNGNNGPQDTNINRPITEAAIASLQNGFAGSWAVANDRLNINIDGSAYTGYVYAAGSTAAFIIDLGPNNGAVYGFKIDDNFNPTNAIGSYKYVDFYTDGDRGAGNYVIDSNGDLTYSWTDGSAANTKLNVSLGTLLQSNIPNVWYIENAQPNLDLYLVVAGDAIMHYLFLNDQFYSWGAGAQIN